MNRNTFAFDKHRTATDKQTLRRRIRQLKQQYTGSQLQEWSEQIWQQVESHPLFQQAQTLLLYHSLPDEVCTHRFIEKWCGNKTLILPVVMADCQLELRHYRGAHDLHTGAYGILEPGGPPLEDVSAIELALIPGMAFDRQGNRLGRGKGYYDRLLPRLTAYKIGICFPFQLLEEPLPTETTDIVMEEVITTPQ